MKLRVGLVGLGEAWKTQHRPALRALADRFEIRSVCTAVSQLAEQVARDFACDTSDGFRALASRRDIDAVLMLGAEWYGPLPILAASDAAKAVYCASVLDLGLEEALHVMRRVESSGIAFMAELPRRLAPATLRLKELIATRLGPPQLLFCHERARTASGGQAAAGRRLMEQADWCRYVIGSDPQSVFAEQHCNLEGELDYQVCSLRFAPVHRRNAEGPLAQISYGSYLASRWPEASSFRPPAQLQVCCERGVAFIDLPNTLIWFDEAGRHHESLESERPTGEQLLTCFYRAVTSLVRLVSGLDDACQALRVLHAARQSSETRKRVSLE